MCVCCISVWRSDYMIFMNLMWPFFLVTCYHHVVPPSLPSPHMKFNSLLCKLVCYHVMPPDLPSPHMRFNCLWYAQYATSTDYCLLHYFVKLTFFIRFPSLPSSLCQNATSTLSCVDFDESWSPNLNPKIKNQRFSGCQMMGAQTSFFFSGFLFFIKRIMEKNWGLIRIYTHSLNLLRKKSKGLMTPIPKKKTCLITKANPVSTFP